MQRKIDITIFLDEDESCRVQLIFEKDNVIFCRSGEPVRLIQGFRSTTGSISRQKRYV